jgi:anti-sigma regulatory factor (Ser/Thr protein kinase)
MLAAHGGGHEPAVLPSLRIRVLNRPPSGTSAAGMGTKDHLSLKLAAEAENVAVARLAVATRAGELGMSDAGVADLKSAVSEACANVVLHAYPDDAAEKPLEVRLDREGEMLRVAVRDRGNGVQPSPQARHGAQLGLLLIGALAQCFQLRSSRERGTELLVQFAISG